MATYRPSKLANDDHLFLVEMTAGGQHFLYLSNKQGTTTLATTVLYCTVLAGTVMVANE
jgi:hypothetical protein